MKRFASISFFLFSLVSVAWAQHPIASIASSEGDVQLKWFSQTDSSVVVYATYTRPVGDTRDRLTISRRTAVISDDMDYRVISTDRIPVFDEALSAATVLDREGQKVNFMMEFEKFPLEEPFDLVAEDTSSCVFSFKGIVVDMAGTKKVNPDRFLKSTPVLYKGRYGYDGNIYSFYYDEGFFLAACCTHSSEYMTITFDIVNDSDHGVLFSPHSVSPSSNVKKGSRLKNVELNALSKNAYWNNVARDDYSTAVNSNGSGALSVIDSGVVLSSFKYDYNSWERIGLRALSSLINEAQLQAAKPMMKELDDSRDDRLSGYIESKSLAKGESYSGYMKVERVRNMTDFKVVVNINERDYEFNYTL